MVTCFLRESTFRKELDSAALAGDEGQTRTITLTCTEMQQHLLSNATKIVMFQSTNLSANNNSTIFFFWEQNILLEGEQAIYVGLQLC